MRKEATEYAQKCEQCQVHAPMIYQPAGNLNLVCSPWPFARWGLDIVGPFPQATGNQRFVLVAVDYFTKWAEAEALATSEMLTLRDSFIPTEVNLCSTRVAGFASDENEKLMAKELNLLEEHRDVATIRLAEYQQKLARRYNRAVRRREFATGDLVLHKVVGNMRETSAGKLAPSWEGPYRVTSITGAGAYYLEDLEEKPLHRPWNVRNLKKFYQ
ncbi:uncharacterized protein LOC142620711 [Castanea sativa]|uniref:uncharacterized protein LOC142620711 n=1 Tax=Castanea sativa TaxID=21020 RepID=UPI003F64F5BD